MNITITAQRDGTTTTDGMTLLELERALRRIRLNGGQDDTPLDVLANRAHRVRTVTADVDETLAPSPSWPLGTGVVSITASRVHDPIELEVTGAGLVTCDGHALTVDYTSTEAPSFTDTTRPAPRAVVDAPQA